LRSRVGSTYFFELSIMPKDHSYSKN
jgi:hypothetical protein